MAERSKSDGRLKRGARTREHILEVARDIFADHGYRGATLKMISAAAQVNLAACSYHFGGKQGLYLEVFDSADRNLADIFSQVTVRAAAGDSPADIARFIWQRARAQQQHSRIVLRELLDGNRQVGDRRRPPVKQLEQISAIWAPALGLTATELRMRLMSLNYLFARYVLCREDELLLVTGEQTLEAAEERAVVHLLDVSRQLLGWQGDRLPAPG